MADPPTLSSTGTGRTLGRRGEPAGSRAPLPATLKKATATLAALGVHERFAACIAHELRAPIALQRALIEVALANPTADTTSLRAMGERVLASCERQQRLIEALLTFARNPCALARHEPIDLATIAGAALQAHRPCELSCVATLEPAWTIGDPDLVERLTANLVGNAIDHNVPTGRIEVATATAAHCAVLSVANSGPPIAAEELSRAFEPFHRLSAHGRPFADGLGLGLAIVDAIASAHGATITARPRPEGGLRIVVSFLAATRRHRSRQSNGPAKSPPLAQRGSG